MQYFLSMNTEGNSEEKVSYWYSLNTNCIGINKNNLLN